MPVTRDHAYLLLHIIPWSSGIHSNFLANRVVNV